MKNAGLKCASARASPGLGTQCNSMLVLREGGRQSTGPPMNHVRPLLHPRLSHLLETSHEGLSGPACNYCPCRHGKRDLQPTARASAQPSAGPAGGRGAGADRSSAPAPARAAATARRSCGDTAHRTVIGLT
ncbi:unnamed protein product [Prorocentrum cordatum]|uniref:Uncharacterized protein n=1 Tax=Prorocentrum cordatum TaxID=2364126 RepID=A0ABN9WLB0_9DINO|nr:unnamed protein product [Polarella glacialis]